MVVAHFLEMFFELVVSSVISFSDVVVFTNFTVALQSVLDIIVIAYV